MSASEIETPVVAGTKLATILLGGKNYPISVLASDTGESLIGVGGGLKTEGVDTEYETVAASQTAQALGATGAAGDFLLSLLVIPATTSPGAVTILDGATSIPVFVGGATSVSNLIPFTIFVNARALNSGGWKVTTGANVSVIASGNWT